MLVEIEAKLKVGSLAEVAKKLKSLCAEFLREIVQRDYYFDDAKASLTKADCCLRLREEFTDKSKRVILAYKGAKQKGRFKKRLEVETGLSDAKSARTLFGAIGYKEMLVFEKRRWLWDFGGCEVALDELPLLGSFVEIEGGSERQIAKVQKELGLADLPHIKESYAALMERELGRSGRKKTETFLRGRKC